MRYTIRAASFDGGAPVRWLEGQWWLVSAVIEDDAGKRYYEEQEFAVEVADPGNVLTPKIEQQIHAAVCAKAAELVAPKLQAKQASMSVLMVNAPVNADDANAIVPI